MSFLLSIIGFINVLTYRIDWIHDFINIKLHENLDDYRFLPEAFLFIDGNKVSDPQMYYERNGVEWTFISTVSTSVVKTYQIKYRVTFPTYQISQTKTIYFNVIDDIPPEVIEIPKFSIHLGQKIPDLKEGLLYKDNYDRIDQIKVTIDQSRVLNQRVGQYIVSYTLTDMSFNSITFDTTVIVYDHLPPDILINKPLILNFNHDFIWQNYMTIKDNYDAIVKVEIDFQYVNFNLLGTYPIHIRATDTSGLYSFTNQDLVIVDLEPPKIVFKSRPEAILVNQTITDELLRSYIVNISDNYDQLSIDDVKITHDIENGTLGDYFIYYYIEDSSKNKLDTKLKVSVKDLEKPVVSLKEKIEVEVNSLELNLMSFIDYYDNYTKQEELTVKITSNYKLNIIGKYLLTVEVTDKSLNKTTFTDYIYVIDNIAPKIIQKNDIIITNFLKIELTNYFEASDNYDKTSSIIIEIDDSLVDYETIGIYEIIVYATDLSNNSTTLATNVMVVDIIEPIIELKQHSLIIQINETKLNLKDYILSAKDNYDHLSIDDVLITHEIEYNKLGVYEVLFQLTDLSKNKTVESFYLTIEDKVLPWIYFDDVIINQFDPFDPLYEIEYGDNLEDFVLSYFPKYIDTKKPGTKTITYIVLDQRGNYVTKDRYINVVPLNDQFDYMAFIPVTLVTLTGISAIIYFLKKRS
jgi:uncharacterized repeat protein (TIGR01451 family)